jgi:hypothetical protein
VVTHLFVGMNRNAGLGQLGMEEVPEVGKVLLQHHLLRLAQHQVGHHLHNTQSSSRNMVSISAKNTLVENEIYEAAAEKSPVVMYAYLSCSADLCSQSVLSAHRECVPACYFYSCNILVFFLLSATNASIIHIQK